nr:MAG TPA: hypothetical protein [Caudoviricetes sp.]
MKGKMLWSKKKNGLAIRILLNRQFFHFAMER